MGETPESDPSVASLADRSTVIDPTTDVVDVPTSGTGSPPRVITKIVNASDDEAEVGAGDGNGWWATARAFAEIGHELAEQGDTDQALRLLTTIALRRLPSATAASVTVLRRGQFTSVAATDPRAEAADAVQYQLGTGPCVDAILDDAIYRPTDLRSDPRWPEFGARVAAEHGFLSMLSFRLQVEQVIAGLNIYAEKPHAFDDVAVRTGILLATHGGIALSAAAHRNRAENLDRALRTSREIGMAIGILMARYLLTREQAFDLLRITSQRLNRKLNELVLEVIDTGALPPDAPSRRP